MAKKQKQVFAQPAASPPLSGCKPCNPDPNPAAREMLGAGRDGPSHPRDCNLGSCARLQSLTDAAGKLAVVNSLSGILDAAVSLRHMRE